MKIQLLLLLMAFPLVGNADLSAYKSQCADIGFKKGTEKFGECVLEMKRRYSGQSKQKSVVKKKQGDGTPEDRNCQKFGFTPGTSGYSQCRLDLKLAADQAAAEYAEYERQKAAYEKAKSRRQNAALMTMGLCLMAGPDCGRRNNAAPATIAPIEPSIRPFRLTTPSGSMDCKYRRLHREYECY